MKNNIDEENEELLIGKKVKNVDANIGRDMSPN